jgi:hypothetical protein
VEFEIEDTEFTADTDPTHTMKRHRIIPIIKEFFILLKSPKE